MAKHMGSYGNACFPSQSPKERVHICIGQRLSCPRPLQFDEQMVRLNVYGVDSADIGHNLINEIRRHIDSAWCMDRFDFRPILQETAITDMEPVFCDVHILHVKCKDFPDTHRRLIQEPNEQTIPLIGAGIEQFLYLGFRDG